MEDLNIMDLPGERWAPVANYDKYEISDHGRVKSYRKNKEKILKPKSNVQTGYYKVQLYNEEGKKEKSVHRLVAEAFIPNEDGLPCVNHMDGVKHNNHYTNLEHCSYRDNALHSINTGLQKVERKPVLQLTLEGAVVKVHTSILQAQRGTGILCGNISRAVNGRIKTAGGFLWQFAE